LPPPIIETQFLGFPAMDYTPYRVILPAPNKNLYELKSVFAEDMTLFQREILPNIRLTINKRNLRKYLTIIICPKIFSFQNN
jgi:hypothetical protein